MPRPPRLAAGRARARGLPTRGTTAPGRLRRMERWVVAAHGQRLRRAGDPLVVDLGYGQTAGTTREFLQRLTAVRADVRLAGVENDRARVAAAIAAAAQEVPPLPITFHHGGFDLAGLRPVLVRAMNVLRQYDEAAVEPAWAAMTAALAPSGVLVEGTCDEVGRICSWVALDAGGPRTLTLSADLRAIGRPSDIAPRLVKALIHRNVPGEAIHAFLGAADAAWDQAAGLAGYGPRQRWHETCRRLLREGWPLVGRVRPGEVTVAWSAVAPAHRARTGSS